MTAYYKLDHSEPGYLSQMLPRADGSWVKRADYDAALAAARAEIERLGRELNLAKYGEPNFSWSIHKEAMSDLLARAEKAEAERDALSERVRVLEEALQPFADVAKHDIGTDEADCDAFRPMFGVNRAPYLTVGHMRRALRALSSGEASRD